MSKAVVVKAVVVKAVGGGDSVSRVLPIVDARSAVSECIRRLRSVPEIASFGRGGLFLAMVVWVLGPELGPCLGAAWHQSSFGAAFSGDSDQVTLCS